MTKDCKIIDQYLTPELAHRCKDELNSFKDKYVWIVNKFKWGVELFDSHGCYYIANAGPKIRDDIITDIKHNHGVELPQDCAIMYYCALNDSDINWHIDYQYDWAVSIYLNSEWEESWGGMFEYHTDDKLTPNSDIHRVLPIFNRGLEQRGQVEHRVTKITEGANIRESIQIFVPRDPETIDKKVKSLNKFFNPEYSV